jgi:uncharacterized hydrophobic protein (TIGR00271 family)
MLQLRVYGSPEAMAAVADRIDALPGARHVSVAEGARGGPALVTADLRTDVADSALSTVVQLGVPPADVTLIRLDTIGLLSESSDLVVVWADVLGQARARARAPSRYLVLMAVSGVIAAFGVINTSSVLIVGAMAISPDLLPITAACTGLVLRRPRLVERGVGTLLIGLAVTSALAAAAAGFLDAFDLLPTGFTLGEIPAAQTHVGATTIIVAFAAGIAGMLAVETRAGTAVGVAISVTTIPAAAYLGVAAAIGELGKSWSAFGVLATNIAMMLAGGSLVLAVQRLAAASRD